MFGIINTITTLRFKVKPLKNTSLELKRQRASKIIYVHCFRPQITQTLSMHSLHRKFLPITLWRMRPQTRCAYDAHWADPIRFFEKSNLKHTIQIFGFLDRIEAKRFSNGSIQNQRDRIKFGSHIARFAGSLTNWFGIFISMKLDLCLRSKSQRFITAYCILI